MAKSDFPKEMRHPNYRPAVISGYRRNPDGTAVNDPPGKPAQNPPVWVNNQDQELQYASLGYFPTDVSDRDAYTRSVLDADAPVTYRFVEYPKWLYRVDGEEMKSVLVQSEAQEKGLTGDWYDRPDLARDATQSENQDGDVDVMEDTPALKRRGRPAKAKVA